MENENIKSGLDDSRDDIVPFFKNDRSQIIFEFIYLVFTFWAAISLIILIHFKISFFSIDHHSKVLLFSALGGFLGGWTFDAKWFYRVTAKGKNNQYSFSWENHKFYWRLFIPFLSGLVAFSVYILASTKVLPITVGDVESSRVSFGLCFILGYFSDLVMTKMAKWIESTLPGKKLTHE